MQPAAFVDVFQRRRAAKEDVPDLFDQYFIFGGKEFIVVDAETAVCTDDLGSSYYGFEEGEGYKVVKYEKSLPKFEVDTWFKREISKP